MDDPRLTTLLERAYPAPRPELPNERVTHRAHALHRRRRVSQALGAVVVVAAVVIGAIVVVDWGSTTKVSTPPATKPHVVPDVTVDHELLLSPNTGLRDGQPIRVSGRHFLVGHAGNGGDDGGILVATCRAGATPTNWFGGQCDSSTEVRTMRPARTTATATPGSTRVDLAEFRYRALRLLNLTDGPVDCAAEACVVFALGFNDVYGSARLWFDANAAPLPTPHVTVTPTADLDDGDQVTVRVEAAWHGHGRNLHSGAFLGLCVSPGFNQACDATDLGVSVPIPIDNHGRATATMTIKSTVLSTGGVADCTQPPGCVIGVQVPAGLEGRTSRQVFPIRFSAAVGARPLADRLPQATIDPPGPYTDGQQVTITAARVPKGLAVGQCGTMPDADPMYPECVAVGVTAPGTITLHRFIDEPIPDASHSKRIDCAEPGRCALYLYNTPGEAPVPTFRLLQFAPLTVN